MRNDLMAYLAHIIDIEWPAQIAGRTVPATEPLLVHLDRTVLGMTPNGEGQSNIQRFLIGALSDVAMARRDRRLATHGNIPDLVWMVLLSGGVLVGRISASCSVPPRPPLHLLMTAALVASGVLVLLLIVGLSSPFHGTVTISPDAYAGVLAEMREAP